MLSHQCCQRAELLTTFVVHRFSQLLSVLATLQIVGMDTWHTDENVNGITVEMHGNIR